MKGNRTHMLLRMSNLSVNDSGRYKNEIYYTGLQSEVEIEDFELKVLGRNKSWIDLHAVLDRFSSLFCVV